MLSNSRIPLNEREHAAVENLLATHDGSASLTRRDPGEAGPVLVHLGDQTFEVDDQGNVEAVA